MKKALHVLARIGIAVFFLIYLLCLAMVWYFLFKQGMPIWQIIIILGTATLIPGGMLYALIRSNKNDSQKDYEREQQVMNDVMDVRQGKLLNTKTNIGKWYLVSFVFVFLFPILAHLIGKFAKTDAQGFNIILGSGFFFVFAFITIMIWNRKKR